MAAFLLIERMTGGRRKARARAADDASILQGMAGQPRALDAECPCGHDAASSRAAKARAEAAEGLSRNFAAAGALREIVLLRAARQCT